VSLLHSEWAEVRTLAIGEVEEQGENSRTSELSYFSRMTDAATFVELVEGETRRRQVTQAKEVAAVMDGAEISAILEAVQQAGHPLPINALCRSLHPACASWPWTCATLAQTPNASAAGSGPDLR